MPPTQSYKREKKKLPSSSTQETGGEKNQHLVLNIPGVWVRDAEFEIDLSTFNRAGRCRIA